MAVAPSEILRSTVDDQRSFFHSLPREYYTSAERFDEEFRKVFARQWLLAGHSSQVREPGQFFTIEIAGESIIVTRDEGGTLRAFYNVCRHRGSQLCDVASGQVRRFVCPYHGWVFAADGSLQSAPTIPDGDYVDYDQLGLRTVRAAEFDGFVFLHLGEQEPRSLADAFELISPALARHDTDRAKVIHELVLDLKANWKLVVENNLECYHCSVCHTTLSATIEIPAYNTAIQDGARWEISHRNFVGGPGAGAPLKAGFDSFTRDGSFACRKLLGELTAEDAGIGTGFHMAPVFAGALVFPDYFTVTTTWPASNDETRLKVQWLVHEDAVEGVDYDVSDVIDVLDITTREDGEVVERTARGVASRAFVPGPLSKNAEPVNHLMFSMYLDWMAELQDA